MGFPLLPNRLMCLLASDLSVAEMSPAWEPLLGRKTPDLISHSFTLLLHPDDQAQVTASINHLRSLRGTISFDARIPSGQALHWEVTALPEDPAYYIMAESREETRNSESQVALQRSEERYRSLYTQTPAMLFSFDAEGIIIAASNRWLDVMGHAEVEVLGQPTMQFLTEDSRHYAETFALPHFWDTGNVGDFPLKFVKKDGEIIDTLMSAIVIRSREGRPMRAMAVLTDVTRQRKAEKALRETQDRYSLLFEHAAHSICLVNPHSGKLMYVNPAFCTFLGYEPEETANLEVRDVHPPDDLPRIMEIFRAHAAQEKYVSTDVPFQRKEGTVVYADINSTITEIDGEPLLLAFFSDITRRKEAESALLESEERSRLILESALDAVITIDVEGRVLSWNRQAEQILGWPFEEVMGQPLAERIIPEQYRAAHHRGLKRYLVTGKSRVLGRSIELTALHKEGHEFPVELSIAPVHLRGRTIFVGFLRDVTERKSLEEQFHHSQKMEAVGRLAGGVAHDFNNFLSAILGFGRLAQKQVKKEDAIHGYLREIEEAVERATGVTQQLLAFSRKRPAAPEVLELDATLGDTNRMLRHMIGEDIELRTRLEAGQSRIRVDRGQLEQVLLNLAVNARDAMPKGGRFTIATRTVSLDDETARMSLDIAPGHYVELSASDTGVGMAPEIVTHIFEPFYTTKERGKGTGLGLSTVYSIVKQSDGHIEVNSRPGAGTTFRILFPRAQAPTSRKKKTTDRRAVPGGTETILLVEDENAVRKLLNTLLAASGYNVIEAANGEEAVKLCRKFEGEIQLLLTDVIMPGIKGTELVEQIVVLRERIKVIYMSGYPGEHVRPDDTGGTEFVFMEKPIRPDKLLRTIRELLDEYKSRA